MKTIIAFVTICMLMFTNAGFAQHEHHQKDTVLVKKDTGKAMDHSDHSMHDKSDVDGMPTHAFSRNLPMSRNGSGTAWSPDNSPMYMWMKQGTKTDWMFHGNVFLRYTNTDIFNSGSRGSAKWGAPNWFMDMMNDRVGDKGLKRGCLMPQR